MRSNGGFFGPKKSASSFVASGIWSLAQAQQEKGASNWTMVGFPVNYLVVAGGGSGGGINSSNFGGGGGGAGGYLTTG